VGEKIPLTHLIKDLSIDDPFVILSRRETFRAYREEWGNRINEWYEQGKVIVLDNPPWPVSPIFRRVLLPGNNGKKQFFKAKHAGEKLGPLSKLPKPQASELREAIRSVNTDFQLHTETLFNLSGCHATTAMRLAETYAQSVHLDIFSDTTSDAVIRGFWNVDTIPRIWWIGPHRSTFGNLDNKQINGKFLDAPTGGQGQRHEPISVPHHIAFFSPGALWFCDSKLIPHGALYGRRMISITAEITSGR
jgi:hypothetical protein